MRIIIHFICLQVSSADSLYEPDQDRQTVRPDLDPSCLTLIEKDLEKNQPMAK